MPIYDMYPYSNLHELNLDFIIKLCEEFKDGVSDIEAQIQAVSDRVEVFENAFTFLSTPDGTVAHLAAALNVHGKLDVNGDIHAINGKVYTDGGLDGGLAEPVNITLTGDVEGTVSTDLKNDIEIQTTVVGGGGGSQEDVFFEGDVTFYDQPGNNRSQGTLASPNGGLKPNRLYSVSIDNNVYTHVLSITDQGAIIVGTLSEAQPFIVTDDNAIIIEAVPEETVKHVKIVREDYDLYYSGDPSANLMLEEAVYTGTIADGLPLALKEGNYIIIANGAQIELQGRRNPVLPGISVGDTDSPDFQILIQEIQGGGFIDYREYYIVSTSLPTDLKILGPKQTGVLRSVQLYTTAGTPTRLTFPNELITGSSFILDGTAYIPLDNNESTFCHQGKTFVGCSIPNVMACMLEMTAYGLTALFAAPNVSGTTMQLTIQDFSIYYTNCEYDDLYHQSGGQE